MKTYTICRNAAKWTAIVNADASPWITEQMNVPNMFYVSHNDGYTHVTPNIQDAFKMSLENAQIMLPICQRSYGNWDYSIIATNQ